MSMPRLESSPASYLESQSHTESLLLIVMCYTGTEDGSWEFCLWVWRCRLCCLGRFLGAKPNFPALWNKDLAWGSPILYSKEAALGLLDHQRTCAVEVCAPQGKAKEETCSFVFLAIFPGIQGWGVGSKHFLCVPSAAQRPLRWLSLLFSAIILKEEAMAPSRWHSGKRRHLKFWLGLGEGVQYDSFHVLLNWQPAVTQAKGEHRKFHNWQKVNSGQLRGTASVGFLILRSQARRTHPSSYLHNPGPHSLPRVQNVPCLWASRLEKRKPRVANPIRATQARSKVPVQGGMLSCGNARPSPGRHTLMWEREA